ncbi:MAG: PQQ-binding-like beta-propeller repeat protein, partial [Acidimicrobiia bacterium]
PTVAGVPASCPVTVPGEAAFTPASDAPDDPPEVYDDVWFGTPDLWTLINPGGEVWSDLPRGADGSLTERTFWWSANYSADDPGELTVTAEHLSGTAPRFETSQTAGAGFDPFMTQPTDESATVVGIELPDTGCWRLTAEYKEATLTYVVWVSDRGPTTTAGTTTPPTTSQESGVEPLHLDFGVSLVAIEMDDGTRFAVLLPTSLVPEKIEITTGLSSAEISGPGFQGTLSYAVCSGDTQDAGSLNGRGALVARVADRLIVCRPDQLLTFDITAPVDIPTTTFDGFDIVPVDVGDGYMAAVAASEVSAFCCELFGPIRLGSLVVTANRYTSGLVTAWDYDTLIPQWYVDMGDSSILLGSYADFVVATPGRGKLVGIDTARGETIWELPLGLGEEVMGVVDEPGESIWHFSTVDFPVTGEVAPPRVRAVDVRSGEAIWTADLRPETVLQWADPALFDDAIVVMDVPRIVTDQGTTTTSHLIALDRATGDLLWSTDLEDPTEGFSDRLLAYDPERSLLIAATPGGEVFSIDPETGQILWRTETGFVRIVSLNDEVVVLQRGSGQLALDLHTGDAVD